MDMLGDVAGLVLETLTSGGKRGKRVQHAQAFLVVAADAHARPHHTIAPNGSATQRNLEPACDGTDDAQEPGVASS